MDKMIGSSSTGASGKKRLWTEVEDNILVDYVSKHGDSNWSNVQRVTGLSRTGKSCRLRWRDQLRPGLKKEQFSSEEEKLIGDLHYKMGNQWAVIAQYLPGRTDNAVKNFWYNRCKRRKRTGLKVDGQDPSGVPQSCPPTENNHNRMQESPEMIPHSEFSTSRESLTPANLTEKCDDASLLQSLSERLELTSIQHVETHQALADKGDLPCFMEGTSDLNLCNMQHKDLVDPISSFGPSLLPNFPEFSSASTSTVSNAEQFSLYTFPECYDGLVHTTLTDGDIVDYWLNSSSLDGSLDQECICQEAICANDGGISNFAAATSTCEFYQESIGSIVGAMAEDEMDALPDLLHPSSSDVIIDHESMCQDTIYTNDGSLSNFAGWANDGAINEAAAVVKPNNWYNSSSADDFLYQEGILQDAVLSENYGTFDNLAASTTSCVPNYGWDQTYIFWSTPFFSEID